jgi:hypothetical protein
MLPFLKKNPDKARAETPAWHTNFRNYDLLPDTKLVRTSFFVNGLLGIIALGSLFAFAYQEYSLSVMRSQCAELDRQITKSSAASKKAVALYKQFQAEELKVNELNVFLKGQKLVFSDVIIRLSKGKPAGIVFAGVEYKETGLSIKGYAQGTTALATGAASAYERQLKGDPDMKSLFKSISMTNVSRDVQADRLMFDIVLSFNPPKSK